MNNDGYIDFIVPTHGLALSHGPFVYLSSGGTRFINNLTNSNIRKAPSLDTRDWHGFAFGDYDGDGNLDLYITEGAKGKQGGTIKQDLLFHGNGDGTFSNLSGPAGMEVSTNRGRCAIWFDFNNDGFLDLFVKNYAGVNVLYANNGDGTFSIVTDAGGLARATAGGDLGSIVSVADYDNDGFMDLAITGDGDAEQLYRNMGNGTFTDVTSAAGIIPKSKCKGMAWGDYDNDGLIDLFVARGVQGGASLAGSLYRNNGDGTFTEVSAAGLQNTGCYFSAVWGDYDNDGRLDLFVPNTGTTGQGPGNANRLFHNNGDGTFSDVAPALGVALQDDTSLHKGAAWADYDNDGFLDLLIKDGVGNERDQGTGSSGPHRLFRNTPNSNHFLKVNLRGVQSNYYGIGARLTVTSTDGLTCFRQNTGDGGGNYFSQGSGPLHFGIGAAAEATVSVTWPSRITDVISNVAANSTITIAEGSSTPTPTPTPSPTPSGPIITKQPASRTVKVGQTTRFNVSATGEPPLLYQWRENGSDLPGATSDSYKTPPATADDSGSVFSVVVSNSVGSVTSRNVQLVVTAGP